MILARFDRAPPDASTGLTSWDQAFLKACYSTEQKSTLQRSEIALDMVRKLPPERSHVPALFEQLSGREQAASLLLLI